MNIFHINVHLIVHTDFHMNVYINVHMNVQIDVHMIYMNVYIKKSSKRERRIEGRSRSQGGIKFEISWEPKFPVNNFVRNNGKNRIIIKTIINIKL